MSIFDEPSLAVREREPGVYGDALTIYGNVLIRRFVLRKNEHIPGHAHTFDHISILLKGSIRVTVNGVSTVYHAPHEVIMAKEATHSLTALQDGTIWMCIFACRDANGAPVENIAHANMDPTR